MIEIILKENVVSNDTVRIAEEGEIFKNNIIAILYQHKYLNPWMDKLVVKKFRKASTLLKYVNEHYTVDIQDYLPI